ncbi:MAG: MerR family transcriptional regulator [Hyphomicrobiales bacterium]|nr:MerR family transcriptional regulator [Hyphomicrobiales bacterium]
MKIGELAVRSGLSAHTLRYYERIGLVPRAHRDGSHQRDYDPAILAWIEFLQRLKTTGMPLKDMLRYAKLREKGIATELDRQKLLETHRATVTAHITELQSCVAILDSKITTYASAIKQKEKTHAKTRQT